MIKKILIHLVLLFCRFPKCMSTVFFVSGILFLLTFNLTVEVTNTETFCISCHEMKNNVFKEYQTTIHYANNSGVRATCPDCHVPKEFLHKMMRKIGAMNELYHKVIGSIDTREKFLAKRPLLAQHVWKAMISNDSRECRNCHKFNSMTISHQRQSAQQPHTKAKQQQMTCIDCHIGIAHQLPDELLDKKHEDFETEKRACSDCHKGMSQAPIDDQKDWNWD